MLRGDVEIPDLLISKQVKLGTYRYHIKCSFRSETRAPPPNAIVGLRATENDVIAVPEYGERVPMLFIQKRMNSKLSESVISPLEYNSKR